jgi:hypothetical protein
MILNFEFKCDSEVSDYRQKLSWNEFYKYVLSGMTKKFCEPVATIWSPSLLYKKDIFVIKLCRQIHILMKLKSHLEFIFNIILVI